MLLLMLVVVLFAEGCCFGCFWVVLGLFWAGVVVVLGWLSVSSVIVYCGCLRVALDLWLV